jgi:hypothetical protein
MGLVGRQDISHVIGLNDQRLVVESLEQSLYRTVWIRRGRDQRDCLAFGVVSTGCNGADDPGRTLEWHVQCVGDE